MRLTFAFILLAGALLAGCHEDPCNPPREILVKRLVPPDQNPYPPQSAQDKQRVALAEAAIRTFWTKPLDEASLRKRMAELPHDPAADDIKKGPLELTFQNKSLACLRDLECWTKDYSFLRRVTGNAWFFREHPVSKVYFSHVVPWSLRRYTERTLPPERRTLTDSSRVWEASKADYAKTPDARFFSFGSNEQLRADEYLVDSVVELKGQNGYEHLLFVVSDDEQGEPALRWFESVSVQNITRWSCYL